MRIAWFTPLSAHTGIAKYSLSAALVVSRLAEVDVWTTPRPDDYWTDLTVRDIGDIRGVESLADYDHLVYNLGNNPDMHADIFDVYTRNPGVVIAHDKTMAHFMRVYYAVLRSDPRRYRDLLAYYYGAEVASQASRQLLGLDGQAGDAALLEPCLWNATGVVVHSEDALPLVDRYPGVVPASCIDMPFFLPGVAADAGQDRAALGVAAGEVLLVSHGRIGDSKRVEQTVRALSMLPAEARDRVHFVVAGGAHAALIERVLAQARRLGIGDRVRITGFLPERDMHAWLSAADIFVNLRYPSTESASGSLIEQLAYSAPIVVSDVGFYASFPKDTLVRTPPSDEGQGIASALAPLILDEGLRRRVGERTRAYAARRFAPALYAERLVGFLDRVGENRAQLSTLDALGEGLLDVAPERVREEVANRVDLLRPRRASDVTEGGSVL